MNAFPTSSSLSAVATPPVMKRNYSVMLGVFCAALVLLPAHRARAQANAKPPTQLTYQGFLTDGNGLPFGNTMPVNKTVNFRIYDALTQGAIKWSAQQVVTVDKGYFSVLLGQGSSIGSEPFNADLTGVFTGAGASERYLELQVDGTTIAPRLRFLPAPYAMLAKSATELVDPITGASSLSIASGNLNVGGSLNVSSVTASGNLSASGITASGNLSAANLSGNGANLTSLNASQITSGTLANARTTATSSGTANTIVARDSANNFFVGTVFANTLSAGGNATTYAQGVSIQWNKGGDGLSGASYFLNQKGGGGGGMVFGEVSTANAISERMRIDASGNVGIGTTAPTAKLEVSGGVVASSFKIAGTPTLVLSSISRGSLFSNSPMAGVTQTRPSGAITNNGRQSANENPNWWKSTSTTLGTLLYTGTFVVPAGEVWEVNYTGNYYWDTDDSGGIVMSLNDTLSDDGNSSGYGLPRGAYMFNQTWILSEGTQVVRVKGIIGSGSIYDAIQFPWHQPSHLVVRKYKSN